LMETERQRAEKRTDVQHHDYREALISGRTHVTNSNSVECFAGATVWRDLLSRPDHWFNRALTG
jgi:hypothetical protein